MRIGSGSWNSGSSRTYTGLAPSTSYTFYARNVSNGTASATVSCSGRTSAPPAPPTPTGVTLYYTSTSHVRTSWTPSTGATSYKVTIGRYSPATLNWSSTTTTTTQTYLDTYNSQDGYSQWRASVRALNANGSSAWSAYVFWDG